MIYRTQTGEPDEVPTVAYYITTEPPAKGCARRFGELARGHWGGCEIRNHWVRDHCMREDHTRSKNDNLNCALSGLRVCLVVIKSILFQHESWPSLQERCQNNPTIAYNAIAKLGSKRRYLGRVYARTSRPVEPQAQQAHRMIRPGADRIGHGDANGVAVCLFLHGRGSGP